MLHVKILLYRMKSACKRMQIQYHHSRFDVLYNDLVISDRPSDDHPLLTLRTPPLVICEELQDNLDLIIEVGKADAEAKAMTMKCELCDLIAKCPAFLVNAAREIVDSGICLEEAIVQAFEYFDPIQENDIVELNSSVSETSEEDETPPRRLRERMAARAVSDIARLCTARFMRRPSEHPQIQEISRDGEVSDYECQCKNCAMKRRIPEMFGFENPCALKAARVSMGMPFDSYRSTFYTEAAELVAEDHHSAEFYMTGRSLGPSANYNSFNSSLRAYQDHMSSYNDNLEAVNNYLEITSSSSSSSAWDPNNNEVNFHSTTTKTYYNEDLFNDLDVWEEQVSVSPNICFQENEKSFVTDEGINLSPSKKAIAVASLKMANVPSSPRA